MPELLGVGAPPRVLVAECFFVGIFIGIVVQPEFGFLPHFIVLTENFARAPVPGLLAGLPGVYFREGELRPFQLNWLNCVGRVRDQPVVVVGTLPTLDVLLVKVGRVV